MTWIIWLALAIGAFVIALLGLAAYGASRWADSTQALLRQLEATRLTATTSRYDARELEGLTPPVQRHFRAVLRDRQRILCAGAQTVLARDHCLVDLRVRPVADARCFARDV